MVTNLVAKEFIAAQNPDDPGVLILSRFAGAAEQLSDALTFNPHDIREVADAIAEALGMPRDESFARHAELRSPVFGKDVGHWAEMYLETLVGVRGRSAREISRLSADCSAVIYRSEALFEVPPVRLTCTFSPLLCC